MTYSFVYVDIETLPDLSMSMEDREKLARAKVPKNIKDPAKIAARVKTLMGTDGPWHRTGFNPTGCFVYTISFAVGDGKIYTCQENYEDAGDMVDLADCPYRMLEQMLIKRFQAKLSEVLATYEFHYVAHNGLDFDFPILRLRGVRSMPSRRYADTHTDTMLLAQGTAKGGSGYSLEALCRFFGLGGKADGMHGSKVYQAWTEGRHPEVARYCARDIHLLRRLHLRLIGEET